MATRAEAATGAQVDRRTLFSAADVALLERQDYRSLLPAWDVEAMLAFSASCFPDKPALIEIGEAGEPARSLSFADYHRAVVGAANLFRETAKGVEPVVAVIMPYVSHAFIAMWGGAIAGRYVPINPFLDIEHVAAIMNAAGVNILATMMPGSCPGLWDRLDELSACLDDLRATFLVDGGEDPRDFATALAHQPTRLSFAPDRSPARECAYLHTGGTTGSPKLVRHTQEGQLLQGWLCGMAMGPEADVACGHAMPIFHVGGAISSGTRGIVFGQTMVILTRDGFRNPTVASRFWDIVTEQGITAITTAPTTAAVLLRNDGPGPKTLRRYTTGGGPLPTEIGRGFAARYGLQLKEVWGGTEFHGILTFHYDGAIPARLGSCGRIVPYHQVVSAILDGNRFVRLAGAGERGVLIAAGPTVIPGYVDPGNDAGFFVEDGPDGLRWATTGDIGFVDEDDFVWITGREKDVIIRAGHNIDSALIDEVLTRHPAVLHAAAVGRPCPDKGELPIAYVELREGHAADVPALLAHGRAHIQERAAVPVDVIVVEAMPMTAVGKVSKPELRIDALRRVGEECARRPVTVEERGGKLTLVVAAVDQADRDALAAIFAPYTFATRIEITAAPAGA